MSFIVKNLMLFDTFWSQNAEMAPKVSINDRFYKVFCIAFLATPKRCVANGFLMLSKVVHCHKLLVETSCFFDTYQTLFPTSAPRVSLNERFYNIFCSTFMQAPKKLCS